VAQRGGGDGGAVLDTDTVVRLVPRLEAAEDGDRLLDRRLADEDRAESAFERRVLLDVLAVFIECRGADAPQLAACKGGFEHVAGGHRAVGGTGADADIKVTSDTAVNAEFQEDDQDNIQAELAKALGLAFQLDGIDYDRSSFRCSDMSMDQLARAMEAEGLDMAPLEGSLAASSLPGRITVFILRIVRTLDIFFDGMIADALKVMLIELFSDEAFLEQSMRQFGDGFARVLIEQRNQVVVDDLKVIVENERDVRSLAIFYGAAHMPDMSERLIQQLGYRPEGEQWFTAFEVDLTETAMSPEQLQNLRLMMRRQLRMMSR